MKKARKQCRVHSQFQELDLEGFPITLKLMKEHFENCNITGFTDKDGNALEYEESTFICPEDIKGEKEFFVTLPKPEADGSIIFYTEFEIEE